MIHQEKQWIMIDIKIVTIWHKTTQVSPLFWLQHQIQLVRVFYIKRNWNTFLRLSPNKKSVWEILKTLSPPSSLNKSRSQTWDHNPDRQTETRWCPPSEGGSFKKSALFLSEMNLAGGFENPRRDVEHRAVAWDDNVCLERPIEPFVCTASRQQ